MPYSQTKGRATGRDPANDLLQAPALAPMQRVPGLDLSVDQPTSALDPAMIENARAALDAGQTHYVDVPGIPPLREALAAHLVGMGLVGYAQGNVLVTAGIQECRFLSLQMVGALFGCAALPAVVHPGARKAADVRRLELRTLPVAREDGMLPALDGIERVLAGGCKLLYIESPVRLTGAAYGERAVREIARLVRQFDAAVIWDQGLAPWLHGRQYVSLGGEPGMAERVVVFGEAWPGLGLESLAVGYLTANGEWLERMRSQKQIMAICTSTPTQYAALKAPEVYAATHDGLRARLAGYRDEAVDLARGLGASPLAGDCANVIAFEAAGGSAVAARLQAGGFTGADGADFGAPGILRLSVTADNAIGRALSGA